MRPLLNYGDAETEALSGAHAGLSALRLGETQDIRRQRKDAVSVRALDVDFHEFRRTVPGNQREYRRSGDPQRARAPKAGQFVDDDRTGTKVITAQAESCHALLARNGHVGNCQKTLVDFAGEPQLRPAAKLRVGFDGDDPESRPQQIVRVCTVIHADIECQLHVPTFWNAALMPACY